MFYCRTQTNPKICNEMIHNIECYNQLDDVCLNLEKNKNFCLKETKYCYDLINTNNVCRHPQNYYSCVSDFLTQNQICLQKISKQCGIIQNFYCKNKNGYFCETQDDFLLDRGCFPNKDSSSPSDFKWCILLRENLPQYNFKCVSIQSGMSCGLVS